MKYITKTLDYKIETPSVITLGKFDGLHKGHELLMEHLKEISDVNGYNSIVFTFDIPPNINANNEASKVITTNNEKKYIFEQTGIDYLFECPFTKEVMCMEPETFIAWLVRQFNIKAIVVGNDFHFGHNRAGDYKTLIEYSDKYGYEVNVINKIQYDGRDISSTYIREEIEKGNIKLSNKLLGYNFFINGEVIHGKKLGRTIGIPTINLPIPEDKIIPPYGVYVSKVIVGDKWYMGVSNIGKKPTIEGDNPVGIETFIIDFCQDIYGKNVNVELVDFVRAEKKFDSIDALKEQMNNDISIASKYYKNVTIDIDNPKLG